MERMFPVLFGVLLVSMFVWFVLCYKLFKMLKLRHPDKYEEMGKPSLIMNNSISNNISFNKFLFKREFRQLNDPAISKLSQIMIIFSAFYLILFIILISLFFTSIKYPRLPNLGGQAASSI